MTSKVKQLTIASVDRVCGGLSRALETAGSRFDLLRTKIHFTFFDGCDRCKKLSNRWDHVEATLSDRSDHSNHMETSLYGNCSAIKVATTAQRFW